MSLAFLLKPIQDLTGSTINSYVVGTDL